MIVLQKFGFKDIKYERPQDAWICGHLAEGKPCDLGPGLDGRCQVTTVCQPRLEGARWQCRRSASAGGPCQAGPLPDGQCCMILERCVPRPSLRTKRRRGAIAATTLMIGVLAALLGGKAGEQYMMPGKLSAPHAGLTNCSACHAGARSGEVDLLHRLFTSIEPRQNSNLCVTCHVVGSEPFSPHTHSVEDLKRITETLRRDSKNAPSETLMQRIAFPGTTRSERAQAEIHCAACHTEHQGVFADLTTISNQRCQTCHVSRFGSFANSHPQFTNFPYRRRPRIIFDHQSHITKHFPETAKTATGAQFALMPRNIVSGEFTRVVQRVPVRIQIERDERWPRLQAGLSARVAITHGPGDAAWAEKAARAMAEIEAQYNAPESPAAPTLDTNASGATGAATP